MNCHYCGAALTERRGRGGGGRVKCKSPACKNAYKRERYRQMHGAKPKTKAMFTQRQLTTMANRQWLRDEMHRRGRCAYHETYFGVQLPVHDDYIEVFEFDHVDRTRKKGREFMVSRLVHRAPLHVLQAEVAMCELVCSNCHQIKTRRNKDWRIAHKSAQEHPQLTFE